MADAFYPFVGEGPTNIAGGSIPANTQVPPSATQPAQAQPPALPHLGGIVESPARIAVFDDESAAPRVVVVQPKDVRSFLEEITATVTKLANEQGGRISFSVIREVVENLVHAYFKEPTISILDGGNTIRFSDQGPGIREKAKALEYGTTSATEEMKRYIRGVGSGLPYAQQYMRDHGGDLTIEDNISGGAIVTISMPGERTTVAQAGMQTGLQPGQANLQEGPMLAVPQPGKPGDDLSSELAGAQSVPQPGLQPVQDEMAAQAFNQQHAQMTQMGMRPGQPGAPQHSPLAGEAGAGQHSPQGPDYPQPQQPGFPQGQQHAYPQPQQAVYPQQPSYQQGYGQPGYPQQPAYPQQGYPQQAWPQQGGYPGWPQQPYPRQPYAPYGMPYPQQPAYQTAPGYPQPMAGAPAGMPLPAESPQTGGAGQPWSPDVSLTERGREAVTYLLSHESVGPTELTQLYGSSMSTWTRELKRLEDQGLVRRNGQKRFLTEIGRQVGQSL